MSFLPLLLSIAVLCFEAGSWIVEDHKTTPSLEILYILTYLHIYERWTTLAQDTNRQIPHHYLLFLLLFTR